MFKHCFVEVPKLKQINLDGSRKYRVDCTGASYPSITTVLSKTKDNTHLFEWRRRVGEEKAQKITTAAATRGTKMHHLCEKFILNEDIGTLSYSVGENLFRNIKPRLMTFDNIRALETGLYSKRLGVAGTVDCIAEVDGVLSVIDFKTSSRLKTKEQIEDYFLQGAFYLNAYFELTKELPKQIVILIAVEDSTNVQEFILKGREIIENTEKLKLRIGEYNDKTK